MMDYESQEFSSSSSGNVVLCPLGKYKIINQAMQMLKGFNTFEKP
jgi:hypothetical protein